ncbi:DUF7553 family protein [Halomarina ordinaria]|uniref:Uncharacterized protein n=1 Tax=Halomarina ordinaria TaxID=3033939 RepID=A0ABD5UF72_9EURY|nr:hypothetical protein [Halomarina sp. PSRA2]
MVRDELQAASDELDAAAESTEGETSERLAGQSEALAKLATAERGPDQGRLDRHMNILRELSEEAGDASEHVDRALEHVTEYREGVGGI